MTSNRIDDPQCNAGLRAALIAQQNDVFRQSACGFSNGTVAPEGRLVVTNGVSAEGPAFQMVLLERIARFKDFTPDNDPHGWHEFGEVLVNEKRVWFKLDLYDEAYNMGSAVPHDPERTRRVMILLFPEEY